MAIQLIPPGPKGRRETDSVNFVYGKRFVSLSMHIDPLRTAAAGATGSGW